MRLELTATSLTAIRQISDPPYYGTRNAAGESKLLYAIKQQLNADGADLIKKHMWKDGHLVDDLQQYLRSRNPRGDRGYIMIFNDSWQIRGANDSWNRDGRAVFAVVRDEPKSEAI